ncbi:MAG: hypothetical protein JSS36_07240 [Proteobacteria bacterium]|nr:hypothetical protein [Pseudomonadota bacterium]
MNRPAGRALLLVWAGWSLTLLALALHRIIALNPGDPDDFMRLLQVRDWLAGQSWWDVRQYRMDAPLGADMHWSRLVDLPIAALLMPLTALFGAETGARIALSLVPLGQLLLAMALVARLLRNLGEDRWAQLAGAGLVPLFPLLTSTFMPLRIDHHGWQAIATLWALAESQRRDGRGAARAGLAAALGLAISLEGLALAAGLAALLGWRWVAARQAHLAPFLAALAATTLAATLATRPAALIHPACDVIGWPHIAAFAAAAALAALLPRLPGQGQPLGRVLALAPVGLVALAIVLPALGPCAVNPFHGLDPLVKAYWLDKIPEGLGIRAQEPKTVAMLLWTPVLVLAGWMLARRSGRGTAWAEPALLALAGAALSLLLMRAGVTAQLLTVPFSALLVRHAMPWARSLAQAAPRIVATLAVLGLSTPLLVTAGAAQLSAAAPGLAGATVTGVAMPAGGCDYGALAALPPATLFTPFNPAPEILVRTRHRVVMGSYHRNGAKMREVIEAFSGDPAQARTVVRANRAAYLVACTADPELAVLASRRGDSLAAALQAGKAPGWLEPVRGFAGALKVYAVR